MIDEQSTARGDRLETPEQEGLGLLDLWYLLLFLPR